MDRAIAIIEPVGKLLLRTVRTAKLIAIGGKAECQDVQRRIQAARITIYRGRS